MTAVHVCHGAMDDDQRGDLIYAGDLVIFTRVTGLDAFRERVDALVREGFGTSGPEFAQFELGADEYAERMRAVQRTVRADDESHRLLLAALRNTGVGVETAYWDWVHLRVLPSGPAFAKNGTGWHRDTWASNLAAQTNWWTPIYPITAERTITFAPAQWSEPVPNTSRGWAPGGADIIPEPVGMPDVVEQRVVVQPDDLLCFSGAQLHGTVPNDTGRARFSVEVRTVSRTDVDLGRGAPAVDDTAPRTQYRWFRHVEDGTPLAAPSA
ncbi:MAG: hypothetical protein ACRDO7_05455 [Nocardioidaceae bacterium]